ncbi:MAG: hypothetical protein ACRD96_03115, partial [Bryobacteraceae bacterium]
LAGVTVIAPGEEAARLGGLPVELLSPSPDLLDTLDRWGIRTFRELAALPETGVAERLGAEGVRLQKLARGQGDSPLRPQRPDPVYEAALELEHPIGLLEPLSFVLSRLLHELCARLQDRALAALSLRMTLTLEGGALHQRTLRLPIPLSSVPTFLKLLQLDLTSHPPPAPICRVVLAAEPSPPRPAQEGLFLPPSPEPEKLELTLARIARLVGPDRVGTAELVDTHRPGAFRQVRGKWDRLPPVAPQSTLAFRVFRPPLDARVQLQSGAPVALVAASVRGKILAAAGPWRTSGDWWTGDPWNRDDWDVALSDGALYRIYRERGRWYVEGRYD